MNPKAKQILAYTIMGIVAPIVGNAAAVAKGVAIGDPAAHFTFQTCIAPSLAAMLGTVPAVIAGLLTKYAGHFVIQQQ